MTIWLIVRKSLRQHALSTAITAISIALASGLLMAVWVVKEQSMAAFTTVGKGDFHAVMGARGSELSLVLFSVFHMDEASATLPVQEYSDLVSVPANRRAVKGAVPIVVGDNYRGFRIVGTTTNFFEVEYAPGRKHQLKAGRMFNPNLQEAVVGSFVAQREGLTIDSIFQPVHGVYEQEGATVHNVNYVVVGVLEPSNTPADHAVWIPMAGAQNMEGHESSLSTDISAILIQFRDPALGVQWADRVNQNRRDVTVANIAPTVTAFFQRFEWLRTVLGAMAALVALVGAGGILASLYNTMNERRREVAILRALGARRGTVFGAIVLESATISAIGVAVGFVFYGGFMATAAWYIREQTGVVVDPWAGHSVLALGPLGILTLGTLAGIVPAAKAYRTDVAENLLPQS